MKKGESDSSYWEWTVIAMLSGGGAAGIFWCIWYLSAGTIPVAITESHHHLGSRAWDVVAIPAIILLFAIGYWLSLRVKEFLGKKAMGFVDFAEIIAGVQGVALFISGIFSGVGFVGSLFVAGPMFLLYVIILGAYLLFRAVKDGGRSSQPTQATGAH